MASLVRIVYISRSTFEPLAGTSGIEPNLARILARSRRNNRARGLVGGLFFGDGCFLQCLEGPVDAVDTLYAKIQADTRHKDVTLLLRQDIAALSFPEWSMKYVRGEQPFRALLTARGLTRFDPYTFAPEMVAAAVECLRLGADLPADALPADAAPNAAPSPSSDPAADASALAVAQCSLQWARAALAIALLALALSLSLVLLRPARAADAAEDPDRAARAQQPRWSQDATRGRTFDGLEPTVLKDVRDSDRISHLTLTGRLYDGPSMNEALPQARAREPFFFDGPAGEGMPVELDTSARGED